MKKGKVVALLLTCCMLAGCGASDTEILTNTIYCLAENQDDGQSESEGTTDEGAGGTVVGQNDVAGIGSADTTATVSDESALWEFSYKMLQENIEDTNPVLSPLSAYLAMGMVGLGAEGETLAEFQQTMGQGMQDISGELMQNLPNWIRDIREDGEDSILKVANSVWIDKRMIPNTSWVQSVADIYKAEAFQAVLSDRSTMKDINKWVEGKTYSLIKEFLSEPLDPESRMALFNTIYFLGFWVHDFEANSTYKEDFITTDGKTVQVDMMHDYDRSEYYFSNDSLDGVILKYRDGDMAFVAMKPTAGQTAREMYEQLNYEELNSLLDSAALQPIRLKLPKFEVEFDKNLNETLQNMGIKRAFDEELAQFGGLGTTDNGYPLYISLVRQKAVVKLDEEGTEAAAVTMVVMKECAAAMPQQTPIDVFFDEPFVYMIMDMESRTPLFMGIMDNPVN